MKIHPNLAMLAVASTLLATACGKLPPLQPSQSEVRSLGKASLVLRTQVASGGYKAQALVQPYTKASINHLVIKVLRLNGVGEQPVLDDQGESVMADLALGELDNAITFSNLAQNTTYRIRCFAYKAPGASSSDLISTQDAGSYTDVRVTDDDRPALTTLKVKLIDQLFDAQATASGVVVTDGGLVSSTGSVSIGTGPSSPTASRSFYLGVFQNIGNLDRKGQGLSNFVALTSASKDSMPGSGYLLQVVPRRFLFKKEYQFRWGTGTSKGYQYGNTVTISSWEAGRFVSVPSPSGCGSLLIQLNSKAPQEEYYDHLSIY